MPADQRRPTSRPHPRAPLLLGAASRRDCARDRQRPPLPSRQGRCPPGPQAREHSVRVQRPPVPGQDLRLRSRQRDQLHVEPGQPARHAAADDACK